MAQRILRVSIKAALLAATCLAASPAMAQDSSIEDRLKRLEALVEGLVAKMDQQQGSMTQQQAETVQQTQQALAETRALQTRQTELEAQIAEPKKQEDRGFRVGNTLISYTGFVKVDAIAQRTSGGQIGTSAITRDFLIPATIPVGGSASGWDSDFNARQSRFIFKTATDVGPNHTLNSQIELDFMVTDGGDERVSNSYTPRLRQAFITYDNWLFGQAWTTFQNVGALPETIDFIGPTPGTVFVRQPMIRYSKGGFQVAAEQAETTVTSRTGARVIGGDDALPDVVARYNFGGDWGSLSAAGILRNLKITNDDFGTGSDSALGYGLSVAGTLKMGARDDLRFMGTAGDGLGRYIGVNIVNDAAVDLNGDLDPVFTWSGFGAYRHFWTKDVRSTLGASYFKADHPVALTGNQVTDESWNAFANIIWSPVAPLNIGIEYMYAERTLEDGRSGNLQKVQLSSKYSF